MTQPANAGKFSVFRYFCYANNQIKTTTENLPTEPSCVRGVPTDSLSKFMAFVENGTKLKLTMPSKKSDFDDAIVIEILINLKNKKFFVVASLKDYNS